MLTSLRSPIERAENDVRDLIPMELVMVVVNAVMEEGLVKPAAVEELVVVEVKKEVLTAVEEVKAAIELLATVKKEV